MKEMKKILVIEDNADILNNIAEVLELSQYHVIKAEDGKKGIEQALTHKPDLILCDIMMPVLDGYGVLHVIQKNPELNKCSFIFLTAKTEQQDVRKGMAMGADDYLVKPFTTTDLLDAIEGRLRKAEHVMEGISPSVQPLNDALAIEDGERALDEFIKDRHVNTFKKKQRIYTEGNHPMRLFFLKKGKVKIFKSNDQGKELIVKMIHEGEFFGYTAMLEHSLYKESADALEDSVVIGVPADEFETLMNSHPEVIRKFIRLLASDVAEKEEQLIHIAYNSLRRKVADALLTVQKQYNFNDEKVKIGLSRENLAAVAGTATESLIRTLTDFKDEKIIDIAEGKISILNQEKLERMLN